MAIVQYLVNAETKKRFRVVSFNKTDGTVTLKGDAEPFIEKFNKEQFKAWGYKLENVDEGDEPEEGEDEDA